ncbi:hypothetical protein BGZ73_008264 [Actinomortierella ambigua]|nr:hypothetical protein BGZ73_008264 [Actinomortierella ambigua]
MTDAQQPPLVFGRVIGTGGYAYVREGYYRSRKVAVKIFTLSYITSHQIDNEIQLLKRLTDRHVIQYYAHKRVKDEVYLITDYAERGSLQHAIGSKKLKPWNVKQRIAHEIAKGLAYIHHEGVIHRDLKSANVLLTKTLEVKLCDFGLSIVKGLSGVSRNDSPVGTYRWMAPELFNSQPEYTTQSDVYALGMVMWEMAANCPRPFKRCRDTHAVIEAIKNGPMEKIPDDTPHAYKDLIKRCWSRNASQRPEASLIASELDNQSDHPPEVSGQLSVTPCEPASSDTTEVSDIDVLMVNIQNDLDTLVDSLTQTRPVQVRPHSQRFKQWRAAWMAFWSKLFKKDQDAVQALISWLLKAAEKGDIIAQHNLAVAYLVGRGVQQSERIAMELFAKAAEAGHPGSQYYLGMLFDARRSVSKHDSSVNAQKAFNWYTKAANQGHSGAQFSLGCMYDDREGYIEHDELEAKNWFAKAAAQGNPTAQYRLARLLLRRLDSDQVDSVKVAIKRITEEGRQSASSAATRHDQAVNQPISIVHDNFEQSSKEPLESIENVARLVISAAENNQQGTQRRIRQPQGILDTTYDQQGVQRHNGQPQGISDAACDQQGVQRHFGQPQGITDVAYDQQGVQRHIGQPQGISDTACDQHDVQGRIGQPQGHSGAEPNAGVDSSVEQGVEQYYNFIDELRTGTREGQEKDSGSPQSSGTGILSSS